MNESLENEIKEELSNWNELKDKVLNVIPAKDISFRTRNVLSSILDRLELSNDDRKDLEKYIIYGGGENIEYIKSTIGDLLNKVPELNYLIDNIQTLIPLFNKLDELFKDTDESLDSFKELYNTLNTTHNNDIKKINDTINTINQKINNDVVLKKDAPFDKGAVKNSAVLKSTDTNYAFGDNSVAIGNSTKARMSNSFTSGLRTEVRCPNGAAFGQDNIGNRNAIFEVGVGTSTKKKNAFEIKQNGDVYITGVGGYNGITTTGSKDAATVINDFPFQKGSGENSAVLKGGNNQVISKRGVAIGSNNLVGLKAYPFIYIDKSNKSIYLSYDNLELVDSKPYADESFKHPYSEGDIFSIHLGNNYYNCGTIINVYGNQITVDNLPNDLPTFDNEKHYFFYVFEKANEGIIDIGQNSFIHGLNNYAYNECSHVEGKNNKAIGKYAHTEGKENEAYYCAHAEGSNNIAKGNTSHAEGTDNRALNSNTHVEGRYTKAAGYASHAEGHGESLTNPNLATGNYSHVEGEKTKAYGIASHSEGMLNVANGKGAHTEGRQTQTNADYAHAEGYLGNANGVGSHVEGVGTQTKNNGEHAEGRFNKSNSDDPVAGSNPDNTIHSVGIGTSDSARKNAHEIMQDGTHYIIGIGGYDGTNPTTAKSVQEVINELVNKLNEITTND